MQRRWLRAYYYIYLLYIITYYYILLWQVMRRRAALLASRMLQASGDMGRALMTLKKAVAEEPAQATVLLALRWLLLACMRALSPCAGCTCVCRCMHAQASTYVCMYVYGMVRV